MAGVQCFAESGSGSKLLLNPESESLLLNPDTSRIQTKILKTKFVKKFQFLHVFLFERTSLAWLAPDPLTKLYPDPDLKHW
jgi:hypothetical protein